MRTVHSVKVAGVSAWRGMMSAGQIARNEVTHTGIGIGAGVRAGIGMAREAQRCRM